MIHIIYISNSIQISKNLNSFFSLLNISSSVYQILVCRVEGVVKFILKEKGGDDRDVEKYGGGGMTKYIFCL